MYDLKIQGAVEMSVEGAEQALDRVGDKAGQMASRLGTEAGKAGKAVDSIGANADKNADQFTRAEGRMSQSIQRATKNLEMLGKTASQRLELNIIDKGLDPAKFEPAIAKLRELEAQHIRLSGSSRGFGNAIQNSSYQIQDFAVQVNGGVDATKALAMQLPQMLVGFGAAGAVIGVFAALLPNLITLFGGTGSGAKDLSSAIGSLDKAIGDVGQTVKEFDMEGLYEQFNAANKATQAAIIGQLEFQKTFVETSRLVASKKFGEEIAGLGSFGTLEKLAGSFGSSGAEKLSKQLGLSLEVSRDLLPVLNGLKRGTEDVNNAFNQFGSKLLKGNADSQKLAVTLNDLAKAERDAAAASSSISEATGKMASGHVKTKKELDDGSKSQKAYNKELEQLQSLLEKINGKEAGLDSTYYADIDRLYQAHKKGQITMDTYRDSVEKLTKSQKFYTDQLKEAAQFETSRAKYLADLDKETESIIKKAEAAELENAKIGMTADQLGQLIYARHQSAISALEEKSAAIEMIAGRTSEVEAIEQQIAALQRLRDAEITRPKLQAQAREWERFTDSIGRMLDDALMRGFEKGKSYGQNFIDSLINSLKTSSIRIVVNYVTDGAGQLVGSLANAGINYVAGTSGSNGGAGNNYLGYANTASTAYSAYNMATTALPAMYAQYQAGLPVAQWMTANYAPVVDASASIAAAAAAQAEAAANLTAAASQAAAEGNVALAAWLEAEAAKTATTTTTSAAAGSSFSSALTGIGLIISGILMSGGAWKEGYKPNGDLHDTGDVKTSPLVLRDWEYKIQKALFGEEWAGSKTLAMLTGSSLQIKTVDKWFGGRTTAGKPELQGTFSTDGAGFSDGRVGQQITKHGGTFTRDKQWWEWQDATDQLDAALDAIFVTVSTSLISVGKALGDDSLVEKIKGFSLDISKELNESTMLAVAGQLTESMGSILYPSIDSLRKSATVEGKQVAETWDQAFSRIMVEANAVSRVFDMMGMTMAGAFGNDNADKILKLSDAFVQVFGSVDALNASFNSYYENFYSQEEKTAQAWKDMTNAFGQLNQTLPTTREGFRALVDSAAKAGDAGLYKSLLDLQGSFANLVPVIDTQTAAQEALAAAQAQAAEQAKLAAEAAIEAARLSAEAFMKVADEARESAFGRADSGMATLERAIDLEKQRATAARDAASEQINGIKGLFGLLDDQIAGLVGTTEQALAAQSAAGLSFIEQAAVSARAGYLPDQSQLTNAIGQARAGISGTQYASSFDREFAALKLAGSLSQIREAGAKQLPVAERALSTAESQLKTLDDTLTNTRRQVDELKGISANTATLGSSIDEMSAAIVGELRTQLSALNSAVLSGLNNGTLSASEASSRLKAGGVETDKFTTIAGQPAFVSSQGAVATASGIATTNGWRGSIDDARKIVAETFASSQPKDFYTAAIQVGLSAAMIDAMYSLPAGTANEWARANNLPAFAQGTNRVPQDMLALIHKDEAIIPAAYNPAAGGSMPTSRLEALVESLTAEVKRLQGQVSEVGNNTRRTANAVNGNPEAPMLVEAVV